MEDNLRLAIPYDRQDGDLEAALMLGWGGKYLVLYTGIAVDGEEPQEVPDALHSLPSV